MRLREIQAKLGAQDAQITAIRQQEKQLRVKKAKLKAAKAQQAVRKAQGNK